MEPTGKNDDLVDRNSEGSSKLSKIKLVYLILLVCGIIAAIVHGISLAMQKFTETIIANDMILEILNEIHFYFNFAYILCSTVSFLVLSSISKYEKKIQVNKPFEIKKALGKFIILTITGAIFSTLVVYIIEPYFTTSDALPMLWAWEFGAIVIFVLFAVNLPGIAGTVNDDIKEFHVFGYHVHESIFGIVYIVAAILLVFNSFGNVVDLLYASLFFLFGGFLFGRDIKDVIAGKFIVKLEDEH